MSEAEQGNQLGEREPVLSVRETGERIESLLDALTAAGPAVAERSEELVHHVSTLYGDGLARMLSIMDGLGLLDQATMQALCDDELIGDLLLVHGLHPDDIAHRVGEALDSVRPYLGSHGGDVELIGLQPDEEGGIRVRLRMLGSCDGCPSSSVTLELAVEDAIRSAAPEVTGIDVEQSEVAAEASNSGGTVIPISALRSRLNDTGLDQGPGTVPTWQPLADHDALADGEVAGFVVEDHALLACRIEEDLLVFTDHCGACDAALAGSRLESNLIVCPHCDTRFDPHRAGIAVGSSGPDPARLEPLPVLLRNDVWSVALPAKIDAVASRTAPSRIPVPTSST